MRTSSLLFSFLLSAASASAQWQPVAGNPILIGTEMSDAHLDAVDAQTAWFANTFYYVPPFTTRISRTTDGGQTWQNVGPAAPATGRFTRGVVEALDAQHAWVINEYTRPDDSQVAQLYYTADGGSTWSARTLPAVAVRVDMLRFFSTTEGTLLDQETGALYRTTDGGVSWQQPSSAPALQANQRLSGLYATDGVLWATVYSPSIKPLAVWTSPDRGLSWQVKPLPAQAPLYGQAVFRDVRHALLLPSGAGGPCYATADGGQSWQVVASPPVSARTATAIPGSRAYIVGTNFHTGYATPDKGSAITYDDGQTWTRLDATKSYLSIQFTSPTAGWQVLSTIAPAVENFVYEGMARYTGLPLATRSSRQSAAVEAFPNPSTTGFVTVKLPTGSGQVRGVRVLDALGRAVYQGTALPADQRLDLRQPGPGTYTLEILTDAGTLRRQLLLQ
jgi:photosystem II stability/assembly factor-like uncharacterized protein